MSMHGRVLATPARLASVRWVLPENDVEEDLEACHYFVSVLFCFLRVAVHVILFLVGRHGQFFHSLWGRRGEAFPFIARQQFI
jgi:hypothetical protein